MPKMECFLKKAWDKTIDNVTSPFFVARAAVTREGKCLQRIYKNNNIFHLFLK